MVALGEGSIILQAKTKQSSRSPPDMRTLLQKIAADVPELNSILEF